MDSITDTNIQENISSKKLKIKTILFIILVVLFFYFFLSNNKYDKDMIIHVSSGQSIDSVSSVLIENNIIKNDFIFKFFVKLFGQKGIISGDYLIKKDSAVWTVAWQLSLGKHGVEPVKVTFREGIDNEEIALTLLGKIASFEKDVFLSMTKDKQGYLFPDTYFFYNLDTTEEIINKISSNFERKIKNLDSNIKQNGKSLSDIIIMASILEGEAKGKEDASMISGILWKRISIGMPLQVDIDKSTYTEKGLPDKPLNNPGLLSINASINPINSKYLYYLHDKDGNVHYAINYEEHKININKYLK